MRHKVLYWACIGVLAVAFWLTIAMIVTAFFHNVALTVGAVAAWIIGWLLYEGAKNTDGR